MNCAKLHDCPRALCAGCSGTDCENFVSTEHYELLKKYDTAFFRGFASGVVVSIVVAGLLVWAKGA